jgi:hypothetical protein
MIHGVLRHVIVGLAGMTSAIGLANEFQGVGVCPAGGTLSVVTTGPYVGRAFDLKKDGAFHSKYVDLIGDPEHWTATLVGPSEENRRYVGAKGAVVVFFTCEARNCAAAEMYGVIDERSGAIGMRVTEKGRATAKGALSDVGSAAIACAKELDQKAAKRAEDSLKRVKP